MPIALLDISASKPRTKQKPPQARGEWRVVRKFEDGLVEVEGHRGRRMRVAPEPCSRCRKPIFSFELDQRGKITKTCPACCDAALAERRDNLHEKRKRRYLTLYQAGETPAQRRTAILMLASPKWRDRKAINAIYDEARRVTQETGIPHAVDHIYPLQGGMACGLHVHWNLQILTHTENSAKSARFPLDQSPAWDDCTVEEIESLWRGMVREFTMA